MRIDLRYTLEVDAEAWAQVYEVKVIEVREDVRAYVEALLREYAIGNGEIATTLTRKM